MELAEIQIELLKEEIKKLHRKLEIDANNQKTKQSLAEIRIDPVRCPDTAKEFSEYEYEKDKKTGEVLEGYPDLDNHHIDAVRYAMSRIWKRRGA